MMASARHSVLALLSLAASISALPAGLQDRQVVTPPRQSVSFENGDPQPTPEPSEAIELPPLFPPKPTEQISLGTPSYWVSWETDTPAPTPAPEKPTYPAPGKPTDQISLGTPSYWISWESDAPAPTPAPEEPTKPAPGKPSDQISLGKPSYWVSWESDAPAPTPAPEEPAPGKPSDQISLGTPSYWISWDGQGPQPSVTPKPTSKTSVPAVSSASKPATSKKPEYPEYPPYNPWPPKSKKSSTAKASLLPASTPKASSTPKPTPSPTPEPLPPKPSDQISHGQPSGYVSWNWDKKREVDDPPAYTSKPAPKPKPKPKSSSKKLSSSSKKVTPTPTPKPTPKPTPSSTPKPDPTPTPKPSPKPTPSPTPTPAPIPDDGEPEYPEEPEEPEEPLPEPPQQSDEITIGKPSGFLSWGKRDAAGPTQVLPPFPWPTQSDAIGLQPVQASVIWDKRQEETEPTDVPEIPDNEFPEDPDFPADPEEPEGPIEFPPFPVPTQPNSIGLNPPVATVIWSKRQEESEDPEEPENPEGPIEFSPVPVPTQPNTIGVGQPVATVIWGKRQEATPTEDPEETEGPIEFPPFPAPTQPDSAGVGQPTATVIWGRDAAPAPTALAVLEDREAAAHFTCGTTTTVSSVKPCPKIKCAPGCHFTPEYFEPSEDDDDNEGGIPGCPVTKTATNVCPFCVCPSSAPPKPTKSMAVPSCPTATVTLKPTCAAPYCPPRATPCDLNRPVPRMERVVKERELVKTILTIQTIEVPTKPTCTRAVTQTVAVGCPTYTCVPGCNAARVVR